MWYRYCIQLWTWFLLPLLIQQKKPSSSVHLLKDKLLNQPLLSALPFTEFNISIVLYVLAILL